MPKLPKPEMIEQNKNSFDIIKYYILISSTFSSASFLLFLLNDLSNRAKHK